MSRLLHKQGNTRDNQENSPHAAQYTINYALPTPRKLSKYSTIGNRIVKSLKWLAIRHLSTNLTCRALARQMRQALSRFSKGIQHKPILHYGLVICTRPIESHPDRILGRQASKTPRQCVGLRESNRPTISASGKLYWRILDMAACDWRVEALK